MAVIDSACNDDAGGTQGRCSEGASAAADVAVIGTGLAGLAMVLALAAKGVDCISIGPRTDTERRVRDTRSTALFGPSLVLLERLGVLEGLGPHMQPLAALRVIDDTGGLVRAPELLFEASEIGASEFGRNIENEPLLAALESRVDGEPRIFRRLAPMTLIERCGDLLSVELSDGSRVGARLVIGADGAGSRSRSAAGIGVSEWSYPQVAIATQFAHERPHGDVSTELHRRAGPMTTVPLPGKRSSLVWVETPVEACRLAALADEQFAAELQVRLGGLLGRIGEVGPRAGFAIGGATADRLGAGRIALVGEAAHRLPPIGAQGLNLGLRDVAWLADLVADAHAGGRDPGASEMLEAYDRCRRGDVAMRAGVVDALNRSLIAGIVPVDLLRGAGLAALGGIGPLRRLFMREGMRPAGELPSLMQPLCETGSCGSGLA